MSSLNSLTRELNPTLDNLAEASTRLPGTLTRLSRVVDEADQTLQAAQPVVAGARPIMADLRPISRDVRSALGDLAPVTSRLDEVTKILVPYLDDLWAFTYNSSSMFSVSDANGGLVRGHLAIPLPDGGVLPGTHGGNTFPNSQGRQEND
jgi:phospholipid/cholesterol/gamma-HCH transport system substrate-binding protein